MDNLRIALFDQQSYIVSSVEQRRKERLPQDDVTDFPVANAIVYPMPFDLQLHCQLGNRPFTANTSRMRLPLLDQDSLPQTDRFDRTRQDCCVAR